MRSGYRFRAVMPIAIVLGVTTAAPCAAQTRVSSLEELRRELAKGDVITVVPAAGEPVAGRLMRLGADDLDVRPLKRRTPQDRGPRDVTIPLTAIRSLERPRDGVANGTVVGAAIGAGAGAAMFFSALMIDRNEVDEWGPAYGAAAAAFTGLGALIGWAVDAAQSKPHIRFDASPRRNITISVQPLYSRGPGIALAVTVSRWNTRAVARFVTGTSRHICHPGHPDAEAE